MVVWSPMASVLAPLKGVIKQDRLYILKIVTDQSALSEEEKALRIGIF